MTPVVVAKLAICISDYFRCAHRVVQCLHKVRMINGLSELTIFTLDLVVLLRRV